MVRIFYEVFKGVRKESVCMGDGEVEGKEDGNKNYRIEIFNFINEVPVFLS